MSRHKAFDTEKRVYTAANGFTLDIGLAVHRDMFSLVLRNVRKLQTLRLNQEETYILQAVVQLFPGLISGRAQQSRSLSFRQN